VVGIAPLEITVDQEKIVPISPIVGGLFLVDGSVVVGTACRCKLRRRDLKFRQGDFG
jgi:hypothetical protein